MTDEIREAWFTSPLGDDALLFHRMNLVEELGRLPRMQLELLRPTEDDEIAKGALLGKKVTVKVQLLGGGFRYWNGWVTRFERGGVLGRFDIYRAEVSPWLWYLTLSANCRIFQDKTAVEIIDAVFADYGGQPVTKRLTGSFRQRAYCVQYRESDFAFVSRLMEEEGIYYYFTHADGAHTLLMTNGSSGHSPIAGNNLAWGRAVTEGDQLRDDVVTQWQRSEALRPLKYTHTDYSALAPSSDLLTFKTRTTSYANLGTLEVFDYPGLYDDLSQGATVGTKTTEGNRLAQLRVDAFESGHVTVSALTPFRGIAAGLTFGLTDHPHADTYLITRAAIEMEFGEYEASDERPSRGFSARIDGLLSSVTYQPAAVTPRPQMPGPQTATVVGPSGEQIHTDEHGRVKLQFRWDRVGTRNETSSCWVRVSHPWASKQYGMIALPRVGDEVIVDFLDGSPDRPIVTGRVYNADNKVPYTLPAQATVSGIKTQSKGGSLSTFNELRFDDKSGSEYIWFQAQKDFHRLVKNDAFDTVNNNVWTSVLKNAYLKVGENYTATVTKVATVSVTEDTKIKLGADLQLAITGALNYKNTGEMLIKGEDAVKLDVGQGLDIKVGQALKIGATSTVHIKGNGVVIDGGTQLTIKAGSGFVVIDSGGVAISGPMVKINSGGSAGTANDAAAASPAEPADPPAPQDNVDPLASSPPPPPASPSPSPASSSSSSSSSSPSSSPSPSPSSSPSSPSASPSPPPSPSPSSSPSPGGSPSPAPRPSPSPSPGSSPAPSPRSPAQSPSPTPSPSQSSSPSPSPGSPPPPAPTRAPTPSGSPSPSSPSPPPGGRPPPPPAPRK